ncbi:MAG: ribosome biogenesis GTPase Der [Betaproteobacteria bacterium]|nr:MAG: ribosome biogenesis GTPase Der [Betaproteobacteria bacterium]
MNPTLVLVGRPNVGKSTLFNRLTRSRAALVADAPGLTRDRHYGHATVGGKSIILVDTGGLEPASGDGLRREMAKQTMQAVDEGDAIVFMVDVRDGLAPQDRIIAEQLRRTGRNIWLVVNKAEGMDAATVSAEFHELGLGVPIAISAAHGDGVRELMERIVRPFASEQRPESTEKEANQPKIAVVGRPNAGKSTLVNALLGETRMIAFDEPGTTRDSIYIEFERNGRPYTVIDTAGVRRRGRIDEAVEKYSVVKTLQAIEDANVVILVLDATREIADQDANIASFIVETGRALVVAINKWDAVDAHGRERIKREYERKLGFLGFARVHMISAAAPSGLGALMRSVDAAFRAAMSRLPTPKLTRILQEATEKQAPPRRGYRRPKLRYAHQGGVNPPLIVVHGNSLQDLSADYRRYLERAFMQAFRLRGTPVRVIFKSGRNPFTEGGRGR